MKANFHTHTKRCGHAKGEDRDYVEAALAAGMHTLGFSDHAAYSFPNGYVSTWRVQPDMVEEYVSSIRALGAEYSDRIRLLVGFEMEYFPELFDTAFEAVKRYGMDYLVLTQHSYGNEYDIRNPDGSPSHSFHLTDREEKAVAYVDQLIAGMQTGVFSCVAHPDGFHFNGDEAVYYREMKRLCQAAKRHDLPLEINLLGLGDHRHYPQERFLKIAAEVGNTMILGCDAHWPEALTDTATQEQGKALATKYGLKLTEEIRFPLK